MGIEEEEHLDPLLDYYWQVRMGKIPGAMLMFANANKGRLHILRITKEEDTIRISDCDSGLNSEAEAELVREIVAKDVTDPDVISQMIALAQRQGAVVH